jgi:hypothetical protein
MGRYYYNQILLRSVRSTNADVYLQEQRIQHGGALMWLIIRVWSSLVQIRRYWVINCTEIVLFAFCKPSSGRSGTSLLPKFSAIGFLYIQMSQPDRVVIIAL